MGGERTVFEVLRTEQDPAADVALLAALEDADLPTASAIVETLLTRNTREALHGLVQTFHLLDDTLKQMVLIEWERLFSVLREAGQSRSDQVRLNVLEMIRRACIYRASYLVESALRQRSSSIREAAAETLSFLAEELLRTAPAPLSDTDLKSMGPEQLRERMHDLDTYAEDRRQLVDSIEAAALAFDIHLQPRVIEISLWFLDDMTPALWTMLTAPGSRAAQVAIRCIHAAMSPRLVPFAMNALAFSELRPHVAKVLAGGTDPAFTEEWLRQSWRLVQPKMARAMVGLRELACTRKHGWELLQLPSSAQRHLARWIACTGVGPSERVDLLHETHRSGSPAASRSALWTLTTLSDHRVTDLLWSIGNSSDPEVAGIARRELARRCPLEVRIHDLLSNRWPDWDELGRCQEQGTIMTFDRLWTLFDGLSESQRAEAAKEVLKRTPMIHSSLARRLGDADPVVRVRALRMVTTLKLQQPLEHRLYQLCHDASPEVRSAAMTAVAALDTPVSRRLLNKGLDDANARVQANAVEAIGMRGDDSAVNDLMTKLASPDNRVRANAIKALLKLGVREAAEALLCMLRHENRMHRISALWLVDRMGLFTLASRVNSMAAEDPDPAVRRQAATLAGPVSAGVQTGIAPGAAPVERQEVGV